MVKIALKKKHTYIKQILTSLSSILIMASPIRKDLQKVVSTSSGTSTPKMEKTDSVLNLTKPSLYGIYNTSSLSLNKDNEEVEEYIEGSQLHITAKDAHPSNSQLSLKPHKAKRSTAQIALWLATRLIIVGFAAFVYNEVTKNIHTAHVDGTGILINEYLRNFVETWRLYQAWIRRYDLEIVDRAVAWSLEGFLLSIVVPFLDKVLPSFSRRLLSSNPNPYHRGNLANDLIRSLITFLGITYAIRHIEWSSLLQMAFSWSLINPALWLLLDGTINGFLASATVAFVASGIIYYQNSSMVLDQNSLTTIFLYVGSFFFCGVIIFGKLGRYLFGPQSQIKGNTL